MDGVRYEGLAAKAAALCKSFGLHDFAELYALSNFPYWNPSEAEDKA